MAEQASVETITNLSRRSFLVTTAAAGLGRLAIAQKHARARRHCAHRFFEASALRQRHDSGWHPLAPNRPRERHDRPYLGGRLRNACPAGSLAPAWLPGARV